MTTARVTSGSAPRPHGPVTAGGQVRLAAGATVLMGLAGAALGAVLVGSSAALGAATGFGLALVFFGTGALAVNAVATISPGASLLVALLTYTLEVALMGVAFAALERSGALESAVDRTWAGVAVIVATLVWLVTHVLSATRSRQPLYDLPERSPDGAREAGPEREEASA